MSQWLEEKYIHLVSSQLPLFHKQSKTTFTFRCVFCHDSKKRANKTRGYFFLHNRQYFYKCHNCNISMSLRGFLRSKAPELYREYQLDLLRENAPQVISDPPRPSVTVESSPMTLPSIASLPDVHLGKQYCRERGLPEKALAHLYFTDEWTGWIKEMGWSYALPEDHGPRLIIPWYDRDKNILGAQARRIDATGKAARYQTLKYDHAADKIYGWERVELHHLIYVVEGPLDSWFLPNAVASMDSDLLRLHDKYFMDHAAVYVWDNEPRNEAVIKNMSQAIKQGLSVVVWPSFVESKDLNDMANIGYTVPTLVKEHTFQGLRAELEFQRWRKL